MKTNENKEKPDYVKYSKKELNEIAEFQMNWTDELIGECYDLRKQMELYELKFNSLIRYMHALADIIERNDRNQSDINKLIQLQEALIKEIRTKIIINKPKDSNPLHEAFFEYSRTASSRLN